MLEHIRMTLVEYLAHRLSVAELPGQLPDGWELDHAAEPDARRLTLKAVGYLAEFQRRDRSEEGLRSAISELVRTAAPSNVAIRAKSQSEEEPDQAQLVPALWTIIEPPPLIVFRESFAAVESLAKPSYPEAVVAGTAPVEESD